MSLFPRFDQYLVFKTFAFEVTWKNGKLTLASQEILSPIGNSNRGT